MSRLTYALSGRDTCSGLCETRHGCDCMAVQRPATAAAPAPTPRAIPTRRGWFDRWVNGMRAAYIRHLIGIGEQRQLQLDAEIRCNDADLARLRVELALVEN